MLGSGSTSTEESVTYYCEYVDGLVVHMQRVHGIDRMYLGINAVRMKESYDAK